MAGIYGRVSHVPQAFWQACQDGIFGEFPLCHAQGIEGCIVRRCVFRGLPCITGMHGTDGGVVVKQTGCLVFSDLGVGVPLTIIVQNTRVLDNQFNP